MTRPPALKRPRTLRWRLVAILAGLLAVTSLVIGIVTVLSLQSYLLGQVDQNLAQASQRAVDAKADLPPHSDQQPGTAEHRQHRQRHRHRRRSRWRPSIRRRPGSVPEHRGRSPPRRNLRRPGLHRQPGPPAPAVGRGEDPAPGGPPRRRTAHGDPRRAGRVSRREHRDRRRHSLHHRASPREHGGNHRPARPGDRHRRDRRVAAGRRGSGGERAACAASVAACRGHRIRRHRAHARPRRGAGDHAGQREGHRSRQRGRPGRVGTQPTARPRVERSRRAGGRRDEGEDVRGGCEPRAPHTAGDHPRVRRAVAAELRRRIPRSPAQRRPHRVGGRSDDVTRRGPAAARATRLRTGIRHA